MAGPIDFSFAVDLARERREAAKNLEVDAETRRQEEAAQRRRALDELQTSTLGVGTSVYGETTGSTPQAQAAAAVTVEPHPVRPSLGRWRKAREFFRPDMRRKRKEVQKIPSDEVKGVINQSAVKVPSLPGSGLLKLRDQPKIPSPSVSGINDEAEEDDMEITALPKLPAHYIPTGSPLFPDDCASELAQAQEEADKQLEDSFEAWEDVKGKRVSARVPLPTEWSASKLESHGAVSDIIEQRRLPTYSVFPRVRNTPASDARPRTASSQMMEEILDEVTRTERVWSRKDDEDDGNDSDDNIFPALWAI